MVEDVILKREFGTRLRLSELDNVDGIPNIARTMLRVRLLDVRSKHYRNFMLVFCCILGACVTNVVHAVEMGYTVSAGLAALTVLFESGVVCWESIEYLNTLEEKIRLMTNLKDACELHSR